MSEIIVAVKKYLRSTTAASLNHEKFTRGLGGGLLPRSYVLHRLNWVFAIMLIGAVVNFLVILLIHPSPDLVIFNFGVFLGEVCFAIGSYVLLRRSFGRGSN